MANFDVPKPLIKLQRFLKAADTLQARNPVVAYYCRLYAVQVGIKEPGAVKQHRDFLGKLMNAVEQNKASLVGNEAIGNSTIAAAAVEQAAKQLFTHADAQDRAGQATSKTANAFYVASALFDVMRSFSADEQLDDEIDTQRRYAVFKAKYLMDCFKSGTVPIPGPLDENGQPFVDGADEGNVAAPSLPAPSFQSSQSFDVPPTLPPQPPAPTSGSAPPHLASSHSTPSPGFPSPQQPYYQPPQASFAPDRHDGPDHSSDGNFSAPKAQSKAAEASHRPASVSSANALATAPIEVIERANKHCKFAMSALQYMDVKTAVQNLQDALKLLTEQ